MTLRKEFTSTNSTIKMYQLELFPGSLLSTLMSFDDDPIVENMIHLNFPELLKKNFLNQLYFYLSKSKEKCEKWCMKF